MPRQRPKYITPGNLAECFTGIAIAFVTALPWQPVVREVTLRRFVRELEDMAAEASGTCAERVMLEVAALLVETAPHKPNGE